MPKATGSVKGITHFESQIDKYLHTIDLKKENASPGLKKQRKVKMPFLERILGKNTHSINCNSHTIRRSTPVNLS